MSHCNGYAPTRAFLSMPGFESLPLLIIVWIAFVLAFADSDDSHISPSAEVKSETKVEEKKEEPKAEEKKAEEKKDTEPEKPINTLF